MDGSNPLNLYDCLIPTLKESRKARYFYQPPSLDELKQELIIKSKIKAMESD